MKAIKLPILILTFIFSTPFAHAQFNTIGYVKKHHIPKKKSPQETTYNFLTFSYMVLVWKVNDRGRS